MTPPLRRRRLVCAATALSLAAVLGGCASGHDEAVVMIDACELLRADLLARLAPSDAVPESSGAGVSNGRSSCDVDLTGDGGTGMRGDLGVEISVDPTDSYDAAWRGERCTALGTDAVADGPGDQGCLVVSPWDGMQSRVEGWAWVGEDRQAHVEYQLIEPADLPPTAEADLTTVLRAAVAAIAR